MLERDIRYSYIQEDGAKYKRVVLLLESLCFAGAGHLVALAALPVLFTSSPTRLQQPHQQHQRERQHLHYIFFYRLPLQSLLHRHNHHHYFIGIYLPSWTSHILTSTNMITNISSPPVSPPSSHSVAPAQVPCDREIAVCPSILPYKWAKVCENLRR